jgi:hypothetical protein
MLDDTFLARPIQSRGVSPRLMCVVCILSAVSAMAQELEPRAYAPLPTGLNFVVVAAGRSSGGVLVDPALPIEDVQASVTSLGIGAGRTITLLDRTALIVAVMPVAWAEATGRVGETEGRVSRSGLADPRVKLSVNLVGGRAQSARDFARSVRPTVVGVSVQVAPPIGQYYPTRLVNLGANRWSFKPEVGVSQLLGKWTVEGYGGVWLFTRNDEFYTGSSTRTQQPVVALQGHASYAMTPRIWAAVNVTWYSGGRTSVDGVEKADLQRNSRLGATMSLPVARQQSIKVSTSTGATTRIGADFRTFAVAWQLTWLD